MSTITLEPKTAKFRPVDQECQPLAVTSHGITHPGRHRDTNEDQFLIGTLTHALQVDASSTEGSGLRWGNPLGRLFVVADGIGGHAAGEQASAQAVGSLESFALDSLNWCSRLPGDGFELLQEFQKAVQRADAELAGAVRDHPEWHGMGTTLTLGYLVGNELFVAHAGDSRCYLLRSGKLVQLTHDHTLVQAMVERGVLTPEEAATHQLRHIVVNALGGKDKGVDVELHKVMIENGDQVLLCTDGLTNMMEDREIASILNSGATVEECCHRLVDRANHYGGRDNITVIVVRCE